MACFALGPFEGEERNLMLRTQTRSRPFFVRKPREVLGAHGKDFVDLLHRISTNDLRDMASDEVRSTVLTTERGRVIDFVTILSAEDSYLLEVSKGNAENVSSWLKKYTITEDVRSSPDRNFSVFLLAGNGSNRVLEQLGFSAMNESRALVRTLVSNGIEVIVFGDPLFHGNSWSILSETGNQDEVYRMLADLRSDIEYLSEQEFEVLRIEEGVPILGKELTQEANPLEAGLSRFVSGAKGCYLGQEVLARIDTYKKLKRVLSGFVIEGNSVLEGAEIENGEGVVGRITSVAFSSERNAHVGLGYIDPDTRDVSLVVRTEVGSTAQLRRIQPPFLSRGFQGEPQDV
jgi:folate-binding protein YgfZ